MTHYTCTHTLSITYPIKGQNNTAIFNFYYKSPTFLPKIAHTLGSKGHREYTNTSTVISPFTGGDRKRQEYKGRAPTLAPANEIPYNDEDNIYPAPCERRKPNE